MTHDTNTEKNYMVKSAVIMNMIPDEKPLLENALKSAGIENYEIFPVQCKDPTCSMDTELRTGIIMAENDVTQLINYSVQPGKPIPIPDEIFNSSTLDPEQIETFLRTNKKSLSETPAFVIKCMDLASNEIDGHRWDSLLELAAQCCNMSVENILAEMETC